MASTADGRRSPPSPVLFVSVTGEPLRFYMPPGVTKAQLQPVIKAGGGVVCKMQEPKAILLVEPDELAKLPATTAHFYVSAQYVRDCVEKNQQLEVEDYRFDADQVQTCPKSPWRERGLRMGYSAEDDMAILAYVSGRTHEAKGNRVWQQMAQQGVTRHSWQSMKDRYRKHLFQQLEGNRKSQLVGLKRPFPWTDPPRPSPERERLRPSPEKDSARPSPERTRELSLPGETLNGTSSESVPRQIVPEKMRHQPPSEGSLRRPPDQVCPTEEERRKANPEQATLEKASAGTEMAGSPDRQAVDQETSEKRKNDQVMAVSESDAVDVRSVPKKIKLGILETAIMEFEESDQSADETPVVVLSEGSNLTAHNNEVETNTGEEIQEHGDGQGTSEEPQPESPTAHPEETDGQAQRRDGRSASKVHTFLFEHESQEDDGDGDDEEIPFTQTQLEEAKEHLRMLMRESKQGLVSVTKSLLINSGDVLVSLDFLLARDPSARAQGPFWGRHDDELLLSTDGMQQKLEEKYGEERVAKRIAFLDTD